METEIRQMKPDDYDILCSVWSDDAGVGLGLGDEREGFERHLRRNPESSFVANHRGRIVGAVLAGHDGRRGYLYHLLVLPEFRGRGLGRALVERSLAALKQEGILRVIITVLKTNDLGHGFWKKCDWLEVDFVKVYSKTL